MKPTSIYDLSRRHEVVTAAEKQKSQQFPTHLQNGSAYDLNHVHAVSVHNENQRQSKTNQQGGSPYDCSTRRD